MPCAAGKGREAETAREKDGERDGETGRRRERERDSERGEIQREIQRYRERYSDSEIQRYRYRTIGVQQGGLYTLLHHHVGFYTLITKTATYLK